MDVPIYTCFFIIIILRGGVNGICDLNIECLDNNPGIVEYIGRTVITTIP